jgi:hypothetical protein
VKTAVIKLCSLWLYRKYVCWRSLEISPYHEIFRKVQARERAANVVRQVSRLKPAEHSMRPLLGLRSLRSALWRTQGQQINDNDARELTRSASHG